MKSKKAKELKMVTWIYGLTLIVLSNFKVVHSITSSFCNITGGNNASTTKTDKPTITVPFPEVLSVPEHYVWCSAEGTPPINISLLNASNCTPLASGIGKVASKIKQEGNYTCVAKNEAGFDTTDFTVALIDCGPCQCLGYNAGSHVWNTYHCIWGDSAPELFWKLIPTTTTDLRLDENKIQVLPPHVFFNLSQLKDLDLSRNQIDKLPEQVFAQLTNLQYLYLYGNKIQILPPDIFFNLSRLTTLALDGNKIQNLPPHIFVNLSELERLFLGWNKIQFLPPDIFFNLSKLSSLSLSENQIVELPELLFAKLSNLKYL